jgi:UDP:flavonoid glycosyltransferase YjiC (YdhE family)
MRILFVGPPLYGLLYPVLSLAQAFRVNGHEVVVASAGKFAHKAAEAGLVVFDALPGFDSEAGYRRQEAIRKSSHLGTRMGRFSFFSEEMADSLIEFAGHWQPDLIVYPPLGVVGPLIAAKYGIPAVMQSVGFGHTPWHIQGVTRALEEAYRRHGVDAPPRDLAWIDVTPPSMSILENNGEPVIAMQYVPYNGGDVWENWWQREPGRKRLLVSLGTVKPMVDGLDLISWVMDSADDVDAEIILQLSTNARSDLRKLPPNVRLVDWIPMGLFLNGADGFIHHGGAGNTLTALHAGIPQIVFGQGADRPVNARAVVDRGCGIVPDDGGLTSEMINTFLANPAFRHASLQVAAEMAAQASPSAVAENLITMLKHG